MPGHNPGLDGRRPALSLASALRRLDALRLEFGSGPSRERSALFRRLARERFTGARDLLRFHDALLFSRAYPDDGVLLAQVERALATFHRRTDLAALRERLVNSGIAGTDIRFRFFAATALWLSERWPARLSYDWVAWGDKSRLEEVLPLLAAGGELPGMDEYDLGPRGWLSRMKGAREGDAAFVTRRLAGRLRDPFVFESVFDGIDAPMRLSGGTSGPSRTLSRWRKAPVIMQRGPLARGRPDLAAEVARPPVAATALSRREGQRIVDMATEAMVTRSRDLDAFAYGDPRDVRLVDCGGGLQFACIGVLPERRLLLESVYGFLTLKNGVPTGYVLTSALYGSAEIAYNVFDTFRGGEAGPIYGRVLSMMRHLFRVDSFTIYPYQLGGAGNEEGLDSGAWWFYRKLGFEPREPRVRRVMRAEEARMRRNPSHRSSRRTLVALARENVYWHEGRSRDDVMGLLPLASVGLAVTDYLAKRFGGTADRGAAACTREAALLLGAGPTRAWTAGERLAFGRWAPLALILPGVSRWSPAEKRALARVMRAKGGPRESDFVRLFDSHAKLRLAMAKLAVRTKT